jgi:multiple antibiotic resistance protein
MLNHILYSTVALIALMIPLIELPIFVSVIQTQSPPRAGQAAVKVAVGSLIVLCVAALFGTYMLQAVGVSFPAFRAAGGLVLILIGLQMLQGGPSSVLTDHGDQPDPEDQLWVPLVMPLTAGPAAITTVITLSIREEAWIGIPLGTLVGIGIATALVFVVLLFAMPLSRVLPPRVARVSERFFGLILTAIGFQMGLTGIAQFFSVT